MKKEKGKSRIIFKWIGNVILLLLIVLVLLSGYTMLQSRRNPNQIPSVMGYTPMSVLTGSMRPMLEPGDMIVTKKVQADNIAVGEVITYRVSNDTLVTHRVIEVLEENGSYRFRTQGDANNTEDQQLIESSNIVGSYVFKIPKGGYIANFTRSPIGFVVLIILPVLLLIAGEIKKVLFEADKKEKA